MTTPDQYRARYGVSPNVFERVHRTSYADKRDLTLICCVSLAVLSAALYLIVGR